MWAVLLRACPGCCRGILHGAGSHSKGARAGRFGASAPGRGRGAGRRLSDFPVCLLPCGAGRAGWPRLAGPAWTTHAECAGCGCPLPVCEAEHHEHEALLPGSVRSDAAEGCCMSCLFPRAPAAARVGTFGGHVRVKSCGVSRPVTRCRACPSPGGFPARPAASGACAGCWSQTGWDGAGESKREWS